MKVNYTFITKDNSMTAYIGGKAYTALNTHPNYDKIVNAIKKGKSENKTLAFTLLNSQACHYNVLAS